MGRGLSTVQKQILAFVLREKFVTCQDLLSLWGLQPGATVDKARYATDHSSLSRSLSRLWMRNLIIYWRTLSCYRTAVTLTDAGEELANAILAEEEFNG